MHTSLPIAPETTCIGSSWVRQAPILTNRCVFKSMRCQSKSISACNGREKSSQADMTMAATARASPMASDGVFKPKLLRI